MDAMAIGVIAFAAIFIFGGIFIAHHATKATHKEIEENNKMKK